MLELHATPLIGATLVLLVLICIWWLIVELGFSQSHFTKHAETKHTEHPDVDSASIDSASVDSASIDPPLAVTANHKKQNHPQESSKPPSSQPKALLPNVPQERVSQVDTQAELSSQKFVSQHSSDEVSADTKNSDLKRKNSGTKSSIGLPINQAPHSETSVSDTTGLYRKQPEISSCNNPNWNDGQQNNNHHDKPELHNLDAVTQIESNSPANPVDTKTPTPVARYQTAAKAKRPSSRSEATLQIATATAATSSNNNNQALRKERGSGNGLTPKDLVTKELVTDPDAIEVDNTKHTGNGSVASSTDTATAAKHVAKNVARDAAKDVHSISVAANSTKKTQNKAYRIGDTCTPTVFKLPQNSTAKSKQSSIEKVVSKQPTTKQLNDHETTRSEINTQVNPTAAVQSRQAAPESGQPGTNQPTTNPANTALRESVDVATLITAAPQTHNRPTLLSKVRVLEHPRT